MHGHAHTCSSTLTHQNTHAHALTKPLTDAKVRSKSYLCVFFLRVGQWVVMDGHTKHRIRGPPIGGGAVGGRGWAPLTEAAEEAESDHSSSASPRRSIRRRRALPRLPQNHCSLGCPPPPRPVSGVGHPTGSVGHRIGSALDVPEGGDLTQLAISSLQIFQIPPNSKSSKIWFGGDEQPKVRWKCAPSFARYSGNGTHAQCQCLLNLETHCASSASHRLLLEGRVCS